MAIGLKRAALIAGVGCAGLAVVLLPPPASTRARAPRPARTEFSRRAGQVRDSLRRATETLIILERRDSLAAPDAGQAQLVVADDVPDAWRDWAQRTLDADPRLRTDALRVPVILHLSVDSTQGRVRIKSSFWSGMYHVLPRDSTQACYAIVGLGAADLRRDNRDAPRSRWLPRPDLLDVLGLCGFYAEFGLPGPTVDRWLHAGAWELSGSIPPKEPDPSVLTWQLRDLLENDQLALVACVAGRRARCRDYIVDYRERYAHALDADHVSFHFLESNGLGDYLYGLLLDQGPAAFTPFWTATVPLDSAFVLAFGTDVGQWTRRWMAERVTLPPNEVVRRVSIPLTMLFTILFAAVGVGRIMRRSA
ncbi:MAG TPA: hypothetical protein VGA37_11425 [Gemmatimonadales bacterium]